MGSYIIKIKDKYFEWSTIVDAPTTYGMTRRELHQHIKEEYGREGLENLPKRLKRVDKAGSSALDNLGTKESLLDMNRAGENEEELTEEEIYERYVENANERQR